MMTEVIYIEDCKCKNPTATTNTPRMTVDKFKLVVQCVDGPSCDSCGREWKRMVDK
jgi:hypothetical protein